MLYSMRLDQDPNGDGFVFELSAALPPGFSVSVIVHAIDTDREPGNSDADTVHINELFVRVLPWESARQAAVPGTGSDYPGAPDRNVVHNKCRYGGKYARFTVSSAVRPRAPGHDVIPCSTSFATFRLGGRMPDPGENR